MSTPVATPVQTAPPPAPAGDPRTPLGRRITQLPSWVGATIGVALILLIWWIASITLFQSSRAIPTPFSVAARFFDGAQWVSLWTNLQVTLGSAAWGFLWGNLAAFLFASLVLLLPRLEQIVTQLAIVTYCIPLVAIGPVLVIVAGLDNPQVPSITLAALSVFFTSVVGTLLGFRAASATSLDVVRAYGGGRWTMLRKVQLIAALPSVFGALRIAAPAAFLGAILAEYLGSGGENKLGKLLRSAQAVGDVPTLWFLALISGAVAGLAYFLVGLVARFVTPWTAGKAGS
ncbi:ABC transporter permease [Nakamurella deserti]|uniref:ABC transporter permease n=1 Tax=Nakamurella deserti TaxID=2164074 RepID=UPI000DBE8FB4|nr:ABC transporter permease subunit [Nakamurella deserti]